MYAGRGSIAPFVASPVEVVRTMLKYSDLKPGENLYDLGCGDGRVVMMAVEEFGANSVGVDLNKRLVSEARKKAKALGLGESVKIIHGNIFDLDLSQADVVTMYLTTRANEKVRPKLENELKKGARIVTHDFSIPGWKQERNLKFQEGYRSHNIYLYRWAPDGSRVR
ncbi:MAG: methyltransferase domain-containing protein [Candidatus Bathyarchaeota archaeon]|jgi:cyclopropane fatty-acyl-phospholipid synthase-like methyltransferase|nr:methyltransferase domain-containing protein [Candidatus Bathyarchaeota archaeon]